MENSTNETMEKNQKAPININEGPNQNLPHYHNPFSMHFHSKENINFNANTNQIFEKKLLIQPNEIQFPKEIDPRHQSLTEDVEEFKHFRNIIATFLNYKVIFPDLRILILDNIKV